jgi:hypothetical protein
MVASGGVCRKPTGGLRCAPGFSVVVPTQNSKSQINPAFSLAFRVLSRDSWKREAALVWNITDIVDVPRLAINSDSDKKTYERLKQKADERKRFAEEHAAKHSTS